MICKQIQTTEKGINKDFKNPFFNLRFPLRTRKSVSWVVIYLKALQKKVDEKKASSKAAIKKKQSNWIALQLEDLTIKPIIYYCSHIHIKQPMKSIFHLIKEFLTQNPFSYLGMKELGSWFSAFVKMSLDRLLIPTLYTALRIGVKG